MQELTEDVMNPSSRLSVVLAATPEEVTVRVADRRPGSVTLFGEFSDEQRHQLAIDAWTVGLRALSNAYAQAQEARLQDVGKALVDDIDQQLKAHVAGQQQTIASILGKFFDPKDGQVTQRLAAFVDDQGVLARLLEKYLAPQNSVLAQTLARQVGELSPLFRKLSPTDSEGLVKVLEAQLRSVMNDGHADLRALDPLAQDGAVARFLKSLREELKGADEDRARQLASALNALDANDQNSLINRLVRETHSARQAVLHAVNPDAPNSPMAIMKQTLTILLKEHSRSQSEALKLQQERQERFEKEVCEALVRLESKRLHDQSSPRGGFDFEDAVIEFVTGAVRGGSCVVEATGNKAGLRTRCKKGDIVVRFTAESAFDGAGAVFEAKQDASYTAQKSLEELDAARANRDAGAGVFVMAKSHAPDGFPSFARFGSNVLVVWDEMDAATDPYLHAAVLLGPCLATRAKAVRDQGDLEALRDVEGRIEDELRRLDKMEKHNEGIRKNFDGMADEIRKAQRQLALLLRKAIIRRGGRAVHPDCSAVRLVCGCDCRPQSATRRECRVKGASDDFRVLRQWQRHSPCRPTTWSRARSGID
jgi:hypothetical protein